MEDEISGEAQSSVLHECVQTRIESRGTHYSLWLTVDLDGYVGSEVVQRRDVDLIKYRRCQDSLNHCEIEIVGQGILGCEIGFLGQQPG